MREVPHRQRAAGVRRAVECGHVVHGTRPVVHVRKREQRRIRIDGGRDVLRRDLAHDAAARRRQRMQDVAVGGKVSRLGDDHIARGRVALHEVERGPRGLEEIDRRRIGDRHLAGAGADERCDPVADALRKIEPPRRVPAPDEAAPPFVGDDLRDARGRCRRQCAERVAVEIDHALRQREQIGAGVQADRARRGQGSRRE